jgi:GT2 family glycosyltransferase
MSKDLPTVAAIVPTFNRRHKLARFLDAISQLTYPEFQVIVVDASSRDGTPEMVRSQFPSVTLISISDRHFWTGATNAGVRLAIERRVDYILTINDDAIIYPDYLSELVNLARSRDLLILGNRIDYLDPQDKVWSLGTHSDWGTDRFLKIAYNDVDLVDIDRQILDRELLPVDALPGNGVLIKTEVFQRIGLYNDRFCPHYHGDSELILRAGKVGISAWIAPQIRLLNDFSNDQKVLPKRNLAGLKYIFFNPKSHLFMPAILYIIWRYCPPDRWLSTRFSLLERFRKM